MRRTEKLPGPSHAIGSGIPAGSFAFGCMFQHSGGVTDGCHVKNGLRVSSYPALLQERQALHGLSQPHATKTQATGSTCPNHRGPTTSPHFQQRRVFSLEARCERGFHQGHRKPKGGFSPRNAARLLLLGVPRPSHLQRPLTLSSGARITWSGLRRWAGQPKCGTLPMLPD